MNHGADQGYFSNRQLGEVKKPQQVPLTWLEQTECAEFFVKSDSKWFIIQLNFELGVKLY